MAFDERNRYHYHTWGFDFELLTLMAYNFDNSALKSQELLNSSQYRPASSILHASVCDLAVVRDVSLVLSAAFSAVSLINSSFKPSAVARIA